MIGDCVVDASVLAALFVNDHHTLSARTMFEALAEDDDLIFYAPDVVYYETLGVLRKHDLRFNYSTFFEDVRFLAEIPLNVTPARDLLIEAADICSAYLISSYDAFYLALSQRLRIPLVTADARLIGATRGKGFDVRFIADVLN